MPVHNFIGLSFCKPEELTLLIFQFICYANSYYVNVFVLGPQPFILILISTFIYSRALIALYMANNTHENINKQIQNVSYCKKCSYYINGRDHHCIFIGRCVQKNNYRYFISYIFYSYLLSFFTLADVIMNYQLLQYIQLIKMKDLIPIIFGGLTSLYFLIFTGGLLSSSIRSIILGIYTVQELKKIKKPHLQNNEIRRMYFSSEGRKILWTNFKANWKKMVGEINLKQLLLVI